MSMDKNGSCTNLDLTSVVNDLLRGMVNANSIRYANKNCM